MGNPTVTPIAENWHGGGFMVSEQRGHLSRDQVLLTSGGIVYAGTVLGRTQTGATATAAAIPTNTGNGTFGTITPGTSAVNGVYTLEMDSATTFIVANPAGIEVAHGSTGVAFSAGGLGFTLTAGGTAFVAGDSFNITVVSAGYSYAAFDPTATSGLQTPVAILYTTTDATSVAKIATAIFRMAEVNSSELVWGANVTTQAQKTAALLTLSASNIIAR